MSQWYEVFDNSHVQWITRQRVAMLTITLAVVAALSAGFWAAGQTLALPAFVLAPILALCWVAVGRAVLRRVRALRRVVWCVKLSDRYLVGYDYTRRKTAIDWVHMRRIDLGREGLLISGPERDLEIPHVFSDFAPLSHRVLDYAAFYEVPLFINGEPFADVDIYRLYPFLAAPDAA